MRLIFFAGLLYVYVFLPAQSRFSVLQTGHLTLLCLLHAQYAQFHVVEHALLLGDLRLHGFARHALFLLPRAVLHARFLPFLQLLAVFFALQLGWPAPQPIHTLAQPFFRYVLAVLLHDQLLPVELAVPGHG
ncbi:MAG: hypothetical protein V4525_03370 [Pseudomonadota bacterium]